MIAYICIYLNCDCCNWFSGANQPVLCMITVIHVSGIGAPVIIRTAWWPSAAGCSHTTPAPITVNNILTTIRGKGNGIPIHR